MDSGPETVNSRLAAQGRFVSFHFRFPVGLRSIINKVSVVAVMSRWTRRIQLWLYPKKTDLISLPIACLLARLAFLFIKEGCDSF